jgi:GntR family transcriptional regulator
MVPATRLRCCCKEEDVINHDSIIPLYQQITESIMQDIHSGKFSANNRLPTEDEMSQHYGVSRITVRRAINDLVEQGHVVKKQGKGTFLRAPSMQKDLKTAALSFTEICEANGKTASAKVLEAALVEPTDADVLSELSLQKGQQAVRILRLRLADGKPLVIEDNHFPPEYAYLLEVDLEHNSLYQYLREQSNINIEAGKLTLHIVRADTKSARLLEVPRNTPLLHLWGTTLCRGGELLHTCRQIGYGEDFDFRIR